MERSTTGISLLELLLERHPVEAAALEEARHVAEETGARLEKILVERNLVSSADMVMALAEYLNVHPISLANFTPAPDMLELVPHATLTLLQVVPLARCGKILSLAMSDPFNIMGVETVHSITGLEVSPLVAAEKEIGEVLQRFAKEPTQGLEEILRDVAEGDVEVGQERETESSLEDMLEVAEEAPVIRIVNSIMVEALRKRVSDIHIEPMERTIRLRYRIDGQLYENPSPPKHLQSAIASRIKIMANLNIAERRVPQDGRFKIKAMGKEADVRVSILPTVHGEKIVMRILDKSALAPSLGHLGLDQKAYENLMYSIQQPHGMILVTGPTGSGKTTTLYSALQDLNQPDVNIITVEDPVEYQLPGINQVQANPNVGLTFAAGLRSILRQDPDIVMIGEIRDGETATIAVQAALTGHLVLSTLHTNDAAGAIARLVYMGVEPFLIASSCIMTQAQRLFRKVCTACRQKIDLPQEVLRLNHLEPEQFEGVTFYAARGCPKCANTGYKGRGAIMEIMMVDDEVRTQILRDPNASAIREIAMRNGMQSLQQVGLQKVRDGLSTIEEILRVTGGE